MSIPITTKTVLPPIECYTIRQPIEEVEVIRDGKKVKEWRYQEFHFTSADKPVSYGGVQYIPLSYFDRIRWDSKIENV